VKATDIGAEILEHLQLALKLVARVPGSAAADETRTLLGELKSSLRPLDPTTPAGQRGLGAAVDKLHHAAAALMRADPAASGAADPGAALTGAERRATEAAWLSMSTDALAGVPRVRRADLTWPDGSEGPSPADPRRCMLGSGGLGTVYRASVIGLYDVAVKVLNVDRLKPKRLRELGMECRNQLRASVHPHVASLVGVVQEDDMVALVSHLATGGSMRDAMEEDPTPAWAQLPVPAKLRALRGVADAVAFMHSIGMVHGDLKPENVLLSVPAEEGCADAPALWVADFGLTATAQTVRASLVKSAIVEAAGGAAGTVGFMAPEVVRGANAGPEADVFGLGVLVWAALTCEMPFQAARDVSHYARIVVDEGQRPDVTDLPTGCSEALGALLAKCWLAEPSARPSAVAVVTEMTRMTAGAGRTTGDGGSASEAADTAPGMPASAAASSGARAGHLTTAALRDKGGREEQAERFETLAIVADNAGMAPLGAEMRAACSEEHLVTILGKAMVGEAKIRLLENGVYRAFLLSIDRGRRIAASQGEEFKVATKKDQVRILMPGELLLFPADVTSLDLESEGLGDKAAAALGEIVATTSTLTTLNLSGNSIGDEGAYALGEALKTNSTLTTLDLYGNSIGSKGACAIGKALKTNSTLTTLNLISNSIGTVGTISTKEAWRHRGGRLSV